MWKYYFQALFLSSHHRAYALLLNPRAYPFVVINTCDAHAPTVCKVSSQGEYCWVKWKIKLSKSENIWSKINKSQTWSMSKTIAKIKMKKKCGYFWDVLIVMIWAGEFKRLNAVFGTMFIQKDVLGTMFNNICAWNSVQQKYMLELFPAHLFRCVVNNNNLLWIVIPHTSVENIIRTILFPTHIFRSAMKCTISHTSNEMCYE